MESTTTATTTGLDNALAQQKMESLAVFAGGIAHDFNNLLMGVTGNLELALQELPADAPLRRRLHPALTAAQRATELTRQMLAYCGKGRFLIQPINLTRLIAAADFPQPVPANVTLQCRLDPQIPDIQSDPDQTQQIFRRLLANAVEATGARTGTITISTGTQRCDAAFLAESRLPAPPPGLFAYLEVTDTGCGMDDATRQRMFDPFFSTKGASRGLGLSSVLGMVRAHGGAIVTRSQPGQGTTVRVLFPVQTINPDADTQTVEFMISPFAPAGPADTVLIVDDEEVIRLLCADMVERLGYKSVLAVDGQEGVDLFRRNPRQFACVLLDLTMPRMDGMTAFIEMRRIHPDVKVILSTGYDAQETTQRFVGHGLAGYLQKPYRQEALQTMMERVLGRPINPPPPTTT